MKALSLVAFSVFCAIAVFSGCGPSRCDSDGDCPSRCFCGGDSYCYEFGTDPWVAGALCSYNSDCAGGSICWQDGRCWPQTPSSASGPPSPMCLSGTRYDPQTDSCYTPECDSIWDCPVEGTGEYANCSPEGFCEELVRCEVTDDCHILLGPLYRCYFGICRYNL